MWVFILENSRTRRSGSKGINIHFDTDSNLNELDLADLKAIRYFCSLILADDFSTPQGLCDLGRYKPGYYV